MCSNTSSTSIHVPRGAFSKTWPWLLLKAEKILPTTSSCVGVQRHRHPRRTLTPRRALDVVREVGAWIWIRDREQGYHNKREAAISHGRIRRSTREQQSHTEEHERIRRIVIYRRNRDNGAHERKSNPAGSVYVCF